MLAFVSGNSHNSVRRFVRETALGAWSRDTSGTVAIIAGFALLPIFTAAGMAVDFGHAMLIKSRMQTTLDSAVLAGGREFQLTSSAASAETSTRGFFTYRFAADTGISGHPHITGLTIDTSAYTIAAVARADIPTPFLRLIGTSSLGVTIKSSSGLGAAGTAQEKDLEISMVLDVTGSMNDSSGSGNSKIHDAKLAAKDLVDIVMPTGFIGAQKTRVALVPFSQYVNVGPYYRDVTDQNASGGNTCVTERTGDDAFTDKKPGSNRWISVFTPTSNHGGSLDCAPAAQIMPLSNDKDALKASIDGYSANGWTAGHLGVAWGWYMLSHDWHDLWPVASRPNPPSANVRKIVVIMTDGDYNTQYRNGMSSQSQAAELCTAMKAGVTVYTIGFGTGMSQTAKDALKACATSETHYFSAEDGDQLRDAFRTIAISLTQLRLTQ
jgi:Flp pilus assembly protein TadG